jgi:hypothetical protein
VGMRPALNSKPSAQAQLVQFNIRILREVRKQFDELRERDQTNAYDIAQQALRIYLSLRHVIPDPIWHEIAGRAKGLGVEPGALLADYVKAGWKLHKSEP